ncbi:gliding motility-associated C-terminal domain-containing protein [Flavobacterium sp. '19STA2R22 D10 B1']|uniref:gliding motility-associated C-terminal domain-containing protein n=1 Tax=Flavobacterium aerium TaxID=3037261 RepID=UPI00278BCC8F|nr:gliding motility-associated C-terminal domain-containing protein [Flavobacterium sp. '19STA2R22 D10 B1']
MRKTLLNLKKITFLLFFFLSAPCFSQLANFTLNVAPTQESCLGNGKLTFTTSGTTPGASIVYNVYLLPNTTVPLSSVNVNLVVGLTAGTYRVVAVQTLNGVSNSQQAEATITSTIIPFSYDLVGIKSICGNDGKITVNVLSGTAVSYEIISGPIIFPLQTSNVFDGLVPGAYRVRAFDACGEGPVRTHTILQIPVGINISEGFFPDKKLPSCNEIKVGHLISAPNTNSIIAYPLQVTYTVHPPGGGAPIILTQTITNGSQSDQPVDKAIPFYNGLAYSYDIKFVDRCGNIFTRNNNPVDRKFEFGNKFISINCTDTYLMLLPENYVGPYTINFLSAPAGFNPSTFNSGHPGPFNEDSVDYGDLNHAIPAGDYTIQMTDACGRTFTKTISTNAAQPQLIVNASNKGCGQGLGQIGIIVTGVGISSVIMTAAPVGYNHTMPYNVSSFINEFGGFYMDNLLEGAYSFDVIDNCGNPYSINVLVPGFVPDNLVVTLRPGCDIGFGSVRMLGLTSQLEEVTITEAPSAYSVTLPHNVSANIIANGTFYMNTLPAGTYKFESRDSCNSLRMTTVTIIGYTIAKNDIVIIEKCGTFDIDLKHTSNSEEINYYWLQKFDPVANTWGHPGTGVAYAEGTLPTVTNSKLLTNNTINYNNDYIGKFRVIKRFQAFPNGEPGGFMNCIPTLKEFTVIGGPAIVDAYSFSCAANMTDVVIVATGVPPLKYRITTKNGIPFTVENGTNNVFTGLEPANYNFQVEDICNNIVNRQFDVTVPFSFEIAGSLCNGQNGALAVPDFPFLTYVWWKGNDTTNILSTSSSLDFAPFNAATDYGMYHVKITSIYPNSCINGTLDYEVPMNHNSPNAGDGMTVSYCNSDMTVDLFTLLGTTYDSNGVWTEITTSGVLSGNTWTATGLAAGTYQFNYKVTGVCNNSDETIVTVQLKEVPAKPAIDPVAPVCEGTTIQLKTIAVSNVLYTWTGPNGYTASGANPTLQNATVGMAGIYTVVATLNGCASEPESVEVKVTGKPMFNLGGADIVICEKQSAIITVHPENNYDLSQATYTWYYNNQLMSGITSPSIEVTDFGTYIVKVNNNGCENEHSIVVSKNLYQFPINVTGGCVNDNYIVGVHAVNGSFNEATVEYEWTGPNGFISHMATVDISGLSAGTYIITVTDVEGCSATSSLVVPKTNCKIPKGVSPNNDGLNDTFDLSGFDVLELKIFNRYGTEVYKQSNYINEWKGQAYNGNILPDATYYYVIKLATGEAKTGWVYLITEDY